MGALEGKPHWAARDLRYEVANIAKEAGHESIALVARIEIGAQSWWAVTRDLDANLKCPTCGGIDELRRRVAAAALAARCLAEGHCDGAMSERLCAQIGCARRALRVAPTVADLRALTTAKQVVMDPFDGSPALMAFVLVRRAEECGMVADLERELASLEGV